MSEYERYLHVAEDGRIWWPLKDAIRLAAGFRLYTDDNQALVPELRATSNRALANERTLIGAFSDTRLNIAKPIWFERDGFRYVDAASFLTWLLQYIGFTQDKIEFPSDLANEVWVALAKAAAARPSEPRKPFESLTLALEEWFDQPLDALPDVLRRRVECEFAPMQWDSLSAEQRRSVALQLDYQHDPATEQDRKFWWEFFERKRALEEQVAQWQAVATPTASELALKEARIKELQQELARMEQQERQSRGGYYPERTQADNDDAKLPARYIPYPKAMKSLAARIETEARQSDHLNHDPNMQMRANEIAAAKLRETGRQLTRNKVAKLLATELHMDEATVLRRIRKQW